MRTAECHAEVELSLRLYVRDQGTLEASICLSHPRPFLKHTVEWQPCQACPLQMGPSMAWNVHWVHPRLGEGEVMVPSFNLEISPWPAGGEAGAGGEQQSGYHAAVSVLPFLRASRPQNARKASLRPNTRSLSARDRLSL